MILKDRIALIYGGARGMGRAIALRFAGEGCSSIIADLRDAEGEKTAADVKNAGKDAIYIRTDVTSSAQVNAAVSRAIEKFGKVDIMVYCAGIGRPPQLINDITEEDYDKVVDVNMKGVFLCCQAIAPHMKENNYGKIVIISSLAGISPSPMTIHYGAAKAGALFLSNCFALEMAKYNTTVNAILPGMIRTDMTADFAPPGIPNLDEFMAMLTKAIPAGREGTVDDIASVALFLASDESSYVTADRICVGGGMPNRGGP